MADTPPTVRRRRLAGELKRLREAAGLDQDAVAAALECDDSKISRIENARSGVRPIDLRKMLALYGVEDQAAVEAYVQLAKDSRQRGWWVQFHGALSAQFSAFLGLESEATKVFSYEVTFLPGLLQVPEYTRALMMGNRGSSDPNLLDERVAVRQRRQQLLERSNFAFWVVVGEAALHHGVAPPAVRKAQLLALVEHAERPNVEIQVLPLGSGLYSAIDSPFTLLHFGTGDPPVVYEDTATGAVFVEAEDEVAVYDHAFHRLMAGALPPDESVQLIQRIAEGL
ncbi:helix-turn-helix domain-containing protein [Embleya sp. NBC_00888]|uniref:helix-turn-helix domain-containing protein n=1 Tax=Embleya sp. NBC_00888 TaxID=2975960 RepID=UPI0038663E6A|nr:helix-turn-helix domain-containing protein [Embleya sp. NBC_00888]